MAKAETLATGIRGGIMFDGLALDSDMDYSVSCSGSPCTVFRMIVAKQNLRILDDS